MLKNLMRLMLFTAAAAMLPACSMMQKNHSENGEADSEHEEKGTKVSMDQLPPAVRKTMEDQGQGGKWEDIEKRTDDGKTIYEGDVEIGGKTHEVQVAEDGKLISNKVEDEQAEEKKEKDDDDKK